MKKSICLLIFCLFNSGATYAQNAAAFKDNRDSLFIYGLQPNTSVEIELQKPLQKAINANSCGLVIVKSSETFSIENTTITPNFDFNVRELPKSCADLAGYPQIFKTPTGAIAIGGKVPSAAYTISFPNNRIKKQPIANACGFVQIRNVSAQFLNLPTITAGRADFAFSALPTKEPLLCLKNTLYLPLGLKLSDAIATAINAPAPVPNTTGTINSQTAQPIAAKNGNYLIISSIPPGTYTVANAANPSSSKTYTVGTKACLVSDRTQIGSPSNFLISRQGLTFPLVWNTLQSVPSVPSCS
jgi:hypothetical protein